MNEEITVNKPGRQKIIEHLLGSALFRGLDATSLENLTPPFEWISIKSGERILRQGEIGSYFYMLVHGRLKVTVAEDSNRERAVGYVRAGEGVGEMSLISQRAISANVTAQRDSDLIRFSKETFENLVGTTPEAGLNIARNIVDRLDSSLRGNKVMDDLSTIVLVAASSSVDMETIAEQFEAALATVDSVSILREGEHGSESFGAYLHRQEDAVDHVVLVCEFDSEEWLRLCVR